jgi:hypothetical protein
MTASDETCGQLERNHNASETQPVLTCAETAQDGLNGVAGVSATFRDLDAANRSLDGKASVIEGSLIARKKVRRLLNESKIERRAKQS